MVIPFSVVSELRKGEKIKTVTEIELLPSSSTYTGSAQHPDMIVRSGRWILKEGIDYILTYINMVDVGTYTVTAQGIGAYSGRVQAVYTILQQEHSEDPHPPINPSDPDKKQTSDSDDITSQETEKKHTDSNKEKTEKEKKETEAVTEPKKEEEKATVTKPTENLANFPFGLDSIPKGDLSEEDVFSLGNSFEIKDSKPIIFFVGAVGIVASICIGAYIWFFHRFLHGM